MNTTTKLTKTQTRCLGILQELRSVTFTWDGAKRTWTDSKGTKIKGLNQSSMYKLVSLGLATKSEPQNSSETFTLVG